METSRKLTFEAGKASRAPGGVWNRLMALPGAHEERRRLDRVITNRRMDLVVDKLPQQSASIVDMSLLGVRVRTIGALVPGQKLTLLPAQHAIHAFPCRVVWASSSNSQMYSEAGLEFCAAEQSAR